MLIVRHLSIVFDPSSILAFPAGVWFTFAEDIAQRYPDAPMHVIDDVLKKYIDDQSFREFLEFEIKLRSIGNKSQS